MSPPLGLRRRAPLHLARGRPPRPRRRAPPRRSRSPPASSTAPASAAGCGRRAARARRRSRRRAPARHAREPPSRPPPPAAPQHAAVTASAHTTAKPTGAHHAGRAEPLASRGGAPAARAAPAAAHAFCGGLLLNGCHGCPICICTIAAIRCRSRAAHFSTTSMVTGFRDRGAGASTRLSTFTRRRPIFRVAAVGEQVCISSWPRGGSPRLCSDGRTGYASPGASA